MNYRIHQSNTSGDLKKSDLKKLNKYKMQKYTPRTAIRNLEKFNSMISRLAKIKIQECYSKENYEIYLAKLIFERDIVIERIEIWDEKNISIRFLKILKYFTSGKYFRYKYIMRQIIKDILGYNKYSYDHMNKSK